MGFETRIVFFDVEGTLLRKAVKSTQGMAPSVWTLIAQHLGPEALAEEEETKKKWNRGEYNGYMEWMADTIRIHRKYGLTRSSFEDLIASVDLYPGVEETFETLRENGLKTALITGGFKAQADMLQVRLGIDHAYTGCEYFWQGEELVHWNLLPADYQGKLEFMHQILRDYKLHSRSCAFVGDGPNDFLLARAAGLSIAFNGADKLVKYATHSIVQAEGEEDLRAILPYIIG